MKNFFFYQALLGPKAKQWTERDRPIALATEPHISNPVPISKMNYAFRADAYCETTGLIFHPKMENRSDIKAAALGT